MTGVDCYGTGCKVFKGLFDEGGREALKAFRAQGSEGCARTFAYLTPKGASPREIYSDAQLDKICDAVSERLAKAAQNGVETIH